jgi:hypothetical protein
VDLGAWLDDVAARAQDDLLVLGAEADVAFEDDGVLVLSGMDVRRDQRPDGEGVLDDRRPPPASSPSILKITPTPLASSPRSPSPGGTTLSRAPVVVADVMSDLPCSHDQ